MQTALVAMRLGWTAYVIPFLFVVSPALLMQGSASEILTATAAAALGVYAVSAALAGWFNGPIGAGQRTILCLGALFLLWPQPVGGASTLVLHGTGLAIMAALWLWRRAASASAGQSRVPNP